MFKVRIRKNNKATNTHQSRVLRITYYEASQVNKVKLKE